MTNKVHHRMTFVSFGNSDQVAAGFQEKKKTNFPDLISTTVTDSSYL